VIGAIFSAVKTEPAGEVQRLKREIVVPGIIAALGAVGIIGAAVFRVQFMKHFNLAQEFVQRLRRLLVEVARRLVGEEDVGLHHQRARHGDALLLADEPTGNLDDVNAEVVLDLFRELHRAGTTIVVVTHNARVAGVADRGYELRGGRLVGE